MSKPFKFEVFETGHALQATAGPVIDAGTQEEIRLEAFEQGYKAGWDDAVAAQAADQDRISADFARNINELSFTYLEVRATILKSLEPLLREMVGKVLPRMANESLAPLVLEQVIEMAGAHSTVPVELVVAPSNLHALQSLAEGQDSLPLHILEEDSLGEGQVFIRLGDVETQIDLDGMLSGFSSALDGFFETNDKELAHG
jgi:flagellar assembly protein FliH